MSLLREHNRKLGVVTVLAGLTALLGLRLWTSPMARGILGRDTGGLSEFLLIPAFFVVVGVGTALFLWEPE